MRTLLGAALLTLGTSGCEERVLDTRRSEDGATWETGSTTAAEASTDEGADDDLTEDDGELEADTGPMRPDTRPDDIPLTCRPRESDTACLTCARDSCCDALQLCGADADCVCWFRCYLDIASIGACNQECGSTDVSGVVPCVQNPNQCGDVC